MTWLYLGLLWSVAVAGSIAGFMLRGTPAEPRPRSGLMHPLASPFSLITAVVVSFVVLLPLIVIHDLITTGQFWPEEESGPNAITYLSYVVTAISIVALWGVVFAQWWQPLYLFPVISLPLIVMYWDPTDPSWREEARGALLIAAAIAALAATGIILRFLYYRLRRRYGAASFGTMVWLTWRSLGKGAHRLQHHDQ